MSTSDFKKDVLWWVRFMDIFNGVSFIPDSKWYAPDLIRPPQQVRVLSVEKMRSGDKYSGQGSPQGPGR